MCSTIGKSFGFPIAEPPGDCTAAYKVDVAARPPQARVCMAFKIENYFELPNPKTIWA